MCKIFQTRCKKLELQVCNPLIYPFPFLIDIAYDCPSKGFLAFLFPCKWSFSFLYPSKGLSVFLGINLLL